MVNFDLIMVLIINQKVYLNKFMLFLISFLINQINMFLTFLNLIIFLFQIILKINLLQVEILFI